MFYKVRRILLMIAATVAFPFAFPIGVLCFIEKDETLVDMFKSYIDCFFTEDD